MVVLYEDNHLLIVFKPGGVLVQGDVTGDESLLEQARHYLKTEYEKPGKVFLGLVHRLDRPVSGVVVLARTSKAASRVSRAFQERRVTKHYLAVVRGRPSPIGGTLDGWLTRDEARDTARSKRSRLVAGPDSGAGVARDVASRARRAVLRYQLLDSRGGLALVEVEPRTGRHHQIRVQLASVGCPVVGDLLYGDTEPLPDRTIALHAAGLVVPHPVGGHPVSVSVRPGDAFPWNRFKPAIETRFR